MRRNIVEKQVKLFIGLAGLFTLSAIFSSMREAKVFLALSLAFLILSPFIAYFIVLVRLRKSVAR